MNNKQRAQKIIELMKDADRERVEGYVSMFDKILLYTIASNLMPKETLIDTVGLWNQVIKKTIDIDSTNRTNYLEGTIKGRASKMKNEPDGEDFRMHFLRQLDIARQTIETQFQLDDDDDDVIDPDSDQEHTS